MANPVANWLKRHRNATNFWLHVIGMPSCFVAAPVFLVIGQYWLALALFVAGYALQIIGHLVEGNRSGEEVLFWRLIAARKR